MQKLSFITFLLVAFMLSACNTSIVVSPTLAPTLALSITPTKTQIPPTSTSTPIPTSIVAPTLELSSIGKLVVGEGFTIFVPLPLVYQVNKNTVLIGDQENVLNISFTGDTYDGTPLTDTIDQYLASLEKRGWQFTKAEPREIQIDATTGIAIELTGSAGDISFDGQVVAVAPQPDFMLFGLGISKTNENSESWKENGSQTFEKLVQTIKFTDSNAACPMSTDRTYGYTEANPIKVGGGDFEGPSHERAYLDHLLGPNGETISYEREGSLPSGDTILDAYHITGPGLDTILYIDEYNFAELQAPIGFTCEGAFPLFAP